MAQVGEPISVSEFISTEIHNEKTCPWHEDAPQGAAQPMEEQTPNEDVDTMPSNLGTKLGENLGKKENDEVWIDYKPGATLTYEVSVKGRKKKKIVQEYGFDEELEICYELQYAPHHLIPGNESLKGSSVVPFLGDDDVIKNFKKALTSQIKEKKTVGYDVNHAENGVWLPSPYALSMSNQWPSLGGIAQIRKRRGDKVIADETEDFKHAYVAAAVYVSGNRQFHMRHVDYSNEVRKVLEKIGDRLRLMTSGNCPVASGGKETGKFDPPMGLKGRLNLLSANLKRLLIGKIWRPPMYTDDKLMQEYVKSLSSLPGAKGKIDKII